MAEGTARAGGRPTDSEAAHELTGETLHGGRPAAGPFETWLLRNLPPVSGGLRLSGSGAGPDRFPGRLDRLRHRLVAHLAATAADSRDAGPTADDLADEVRSLLRAQPVGSTAGYDRFALEYSLSEGSIPLAVGRFEPAH